MIKHVFLDIGDTLVRFQPGTSPAQRIAHLLDSSSLDRIMQIVFCEPHQTVMSMIASLESQLGRTCSSAIQQHIRAIWEEEASNWTLIPNTQEFLATLTRHGFALHLASTTWHPLFESLMRRLDITAFMTSTLSYRIGMMKSRQFYEYALERAHARASESVMVGDSMTDDILPSHALGITPILLSRRPVNTTVLPKGTYLAQDFDEVLHVLISLNS